MLGGQGFYRGSTILVSGTAGSGKTSLAGTFVDAVCRRGERCLYFSFEESPDQIIRNMRSIGMNLGNWVKKGLLQFHSNRATFYGLEAHLATIHRLVEEFEPQVVVLDPVGTLIQAGNLRGANIMLMRLIDFLKMRETTAFFTNLTSGGNALERTDVGISSLVDSWLLVRDIELSGERNRAMYVLKSRGMAHSNQIREFLLTDHGVDLLDAYVGPEGVLTGSSRVSQENRERAESQARRHEAERKRRELVRKRGVLAARMMALKKEFEAEEEEADVLAMEEGAREKAINEGREAMARSRSANENHGPALIRKTSRSSK
jgi:circadian clock protein KaiC